MNKKDLNGKIQTANGLQVREVDALIHKWTSAVGAGQTPQSGALAAEVKGL